VLCLIKQGERYSVVLS